MSLNPARLTNWPAIQNFVPTAHSDTYPFISTNAVDLGDKSVFITGASKGIGKGIALSFARAGCSRIAVAARTGMAELEAQILSAAQAESKPKPRVLAITLDITSSAGVAAAASAVSGAFGGVLDILINNAGRSSAQVPLAEGDVDDWWATWELNIKGTYLCTRAFLPLLLESCTRTVVVVSSSGAHMLLENMLGYLMSKTALCRFAEHLAKEHEDQGLIAVAVNPGNVRTDLTAVLGDEMAPFFADTPELAGDWMVWLAKERRDWLSGRFVSVNWDVQELERKREQIVGEDLLKFRLTI